MLILGRSTKSLEQRKKEKRSAREITHKPGQRRKTQRTGPTEKEERGKERGNRGEEEGNRRKEEKERGLIKFEKVDIARPPDALTV